MYCLVYISSKKDLAVDNVVVTPILEVGDTTPITYSVSADGTVEGVRSLPYGVTLTADAVGVNIECEYNRDINKAFEEITQAIISLGGNT